MDEPKDEKPSKEREAESQPAEAPRTKVSVAERDPLSVVVVDAPAAQPQVLPEQRIGVPVDTTFGVGEPPAKRRVPYWYYALVGIAVLLLAASWKQIYSRFLVRAEDSMQRHVLGDKVIEAPKSVPHTTRQKSSSWF